MKQEAHDRMAERVARIAGMDTKGWLGTAPMESGDRIRVYDEELTVSMDPSPEESGRITAARLTLTPAGDGERITAEVSPMGGRVTGTNQAGPPVVRLMRENVARALFDAITEQYLNSGVELRAGEKADTKEVP